MASKHKFGEEYQLGLGHLKNILGDSEYAIVMSLMSAAYHNGAADALKKIGKELKTKKATK